MWLRHRKARQPLEAICVIACSTIAEGSGIRVSSTPLRISPPAMPNRPDRNAVATIVDALASLTAKVTAPSSIRVLTIGVGPTFAMRWLIPRLADFRLTEPDIDVWITTGGAAAPFGDDWSCGIKLGDGEWPGLVAQPLFPADLLPACPPPLAAPLKRPR